MNHIFLQRRAKLEQLQRQRGLREKAGVKRPEASVFEQCPACGAAVAKRDLARSLYVCPGWAEGAQPEADRGRKRVKMRLMIR